ncbi:MAG TPA: hypothetical protein ENJ34_01625 [Epsilonproteobacteria bacterium]|nr:hypothetical protein [Campylobacterota bacterium]
MKEHKKNEKTYWPHMIIGFIFIGITLGYWTVKHAVQMPVQEVNEYMMKYQDADMGINDILEKKQAFDKDYTIKLNDVVMMVMTDNVNSKIPQPNAVTLSKGANHFSYSVTKKDGTVVSNAKVSFLLTRPHTVKDDVMIEKVSFKDGMYVTPELNIQNPGRYTLQFRAKIDDNTVGYAQERAYLKP